MKQNCNIAVSGDGIHGRECDGRPVKRLARYLALPVIALAAALLATVVAPASHAAALTLKPDLPTGQPVGTTVTWTVGGVNETSRVQLEVGRVSDQEGAPLSIRYHYSDKFVMPWTPLEDGTYQVVASVVDEAQPSEPVTVSEVFEIQSRTSGAPVVSATKHPLVALYSMGACLPSRSVEVEFRAIAGGRLFRTSRQSCDGVHSVNFLVAGMRPETTYLMRHKVYNASGVRVLTGPDRLFRTGEPAVPLIAASVTVPPTAGASRDEPIILWSAAGPDPVVATDTSGSPVWYYAPVEGGSGNWQLMRPTPAGTMLLIGDDDGDSRTRLREIDLAGNIVREVTAYRLSKQSRIQGGRDPFTTFHHEARVLPNGHTAVLINVERLYRDVQGEGIVNILGDVVMVLDENWQRVWEWNAYDHLDIYRLATLNESCAPAQPGCPGDLYNADVANDWTHGNAVAYSPDDGDLIVSLRHWDGVLKIDYADGAGNGAVEWELGMFGGFRPVAEPGVWPWATHQHDPNFVSGDTIVVYDNGNAQPACVDFEVCKSRGLVYRLDESTMTAELIVNADLNNYAFAVGSAQPMRNGNYAFNSGFFDGGFTARSQEIDATGQIVYEVEIAARMYRSFRMQDLYTPPPE
jgi:arylsulfate sulfotransferase